ncbi:MAG: DUF4912 domain-containing protein [Spirochaetaceae bacterium]|jgi:hypothetical protein|nr:DUF4912 domain-containing protein [Spirochaetaceae bacterium]
MGISLTRSHLDSLSSADLLLLADEYVIDVPDGLNRRFVIGELLEVIEEQNNIQIASENLEAGEYPQEEESLPFSYNETRISVLLRNPAWAYVYWDIKEADVLGHTAKPYFNSFVLRVSFFADENSEKVHDSYDIPIKIEDREWYVFLCQGEKSFRIDLVVEFRNLKAQVLAQSRRLPIPRVSPVIDQVATEENIPPLLQLSELGKLKRDHFTNYRQSFS